MKRLMLRHAFQFVNCVVFLIGPQNWRSQRAIEKIGGVRVGSRLDGTPIFSLRENAIVKEPGLSYPKHWRCVS